jgi:membrane protein required for colicin V production
MTFSAFDTVCVVLIFIVTVRAGLRGLVEEFLGTASFILGGIFAVSFFDEGAAFIRTKTMADVKYIPEILAFVCLFFIVFALVKIIEILLKDIVDRVQLGGLNHALGLVLGLLESVIFIALIIVIIHIQPLFDPVAVLSENSFFVRFCSFGLKFVPPNMLR